MDHAGIVVNDLDAAVAFFSELGLDVEGRTAVEGETVDRLCGLHGMRADIAMMRTPDGHGRIELTKYISPSAGGDGRAPVTTLGIRNVMFEVDDLDDTIGRLRGHGAQLVGDVVQYEDTYRLCYLRGPEGIIVALAQDLR